MTRPWTPVPVRVIKVGGSVLTDLHAYRRVARHLADRLVDSPGERFAVVVSAEQGLTDSLLAVAHDYTSDPDPAVVDLLWSTGELKSVALLALALQALGVPTAAANVHQVGLAADLIESPVALLRLRALLATADVVVLPGFLARGNGDSIVSLGRGGSDLTAVLLAARLHAGSCELLKDVPGYFTADPASHADAAHVASIDLDDALAMAHAGCELVQLRALEFARRLGISIVVRSLDDERHTIVRSNRNRTIASRTTAALAETVRSGV